MTVKGFRNSPVSWGKSEHGNTQGGENDYTIIAKDKDQAITFQLIGADEN